MCSTNYLRPIVLWPEGSLELIALLSVLLLATVSLAGEVGFFWLSFLEVFSLDCLNTSSKRLSYFFVN